MQDPFIFGGSKPPPYSPFAPPYVTNYSLFIIHHSLPTPPYPILPCDTKTALVGRFTYAVLLKIYSLIGISAAEFLIDIVQDAEFFDAPEGSDEVIRLSVARQPSDDGFGVKKLKL